MQLDGLDTILKGVKYLTVTLRAAHLLAKGTNAPLDKEFKLTSGNGSHISFRSS